VVTETYPREFYQYFRSNLSGRGSKKEQADRLQWIPGLIGWADTLGVSWRADIAQRVQTGFSDDINGEDEFDAVVGLLGMIGVVTGAIESGEPQDDPAVTSVEGWIVGRQSSGRPKPIVAVPVVVETSAEIQVPSAPVDSNNEDRNDLDREADEILPHVGNDDTPNFSAAVSEPPMWTPPEGWGTVRDYLVVRNESGRNGRRLLLHPRRRQ
jgi:hypothetical protein